MNFLKIVVLIKNIKALRKERLVWILKLMLVELFRLMTTIIFKGSLWMQKQVTRPSIVDGEMQQKAVIKKKFS